MSPETSKITRFIPLEISVRNYQKANFDGGKEDGRYTGACLSQLEGEAWVLERILEWVKNPQNILVYHGSPGIGKTFLCAALTEWSFLKFDTRRYWKDEVLLKRLRDGISEGFGDYLTNLSYLTDDQFVILDDVGSGINADKESKRDLEFRREIFFSFLDARYNSKQPTVITSNFSKEEFMKVYSPRICSRLFSAENTVIEILDGIDKRSLGY